MDSDNHLYRVLLIIAAAVAWLGIAVVSYNSGEWLLMVVGLIGMWVWISVIGML